MIDKLILTKQHLTELRSFLGKLPYDTIEPVMTFFKNLEQLQLQEQANAEAEKAEVETPKEES